MIKRSLILLGVLSLTSYCTHKSVDTAADLREPAALENLVERYEMQALGELLGNDSPVAPYRHKMSFGISTNGDGAYLSEKAKKSLQEALAKTLSSDTSDQGLAKAAAGNLKAAIIDNFIKTLKVLKIVNTGVQFDLYFTPEGNDPQSFDDQLSSNQLVRLNETGMLSQKLAAADKFTYADVTYNNSAFIPQKGKDFQYVGGVMSVYVEILDTTPGLKIPRPLKKGVKGYVRYRRYYKTDNQPGDINCDGFKMKARRVSPQVPVFYTVDLYSNFNLAQLIPVEESLEIYPGRLMASNDGRSEALPRKSDRLGKTITTASYPVQSPQLSTGKMEFGLKKLVYSLKDKSFDLDKSQVDVLHYISPSDADDQMLAAANARRTFIKSCSGQLKKTFYVNQLIERGIL